MSDDERARCEYSSGMVTPRRAHRPWTALGSTRFAGVFVVSSLFIAGTARAAPFVWKGHTWKVTSGAMAGVAEGSPSNVSIDTDGYLHLKITNTAGKWTASELFTTDNLGFGTYQWQVDAPIDRFDQNVVLGLFPYGPAAGIGKDGTNEIDIEYSFWAQPTGPNGDWTDYPASGKTVGELSYTFSLNGGTLSTSRFIWNATSIEDFLMTGLQPVGSTTGLVKSWTYAPTDPTVNIPQQPLPLGMNLWCFQDTPSDGNDVEVVIRDFEFVPESDGGTSAIPEDAGAEAGAGVDASTGTDAGVGANEDAGEGDGSDAGTGAQASVSADAGTGAGGDASEGAGAGAPSSSGCSCETARRGPPLGAGLLALLASLTLVLRRGRPSSLERSRR